MNKNIILFFLAKSYATFNSTASFVIRSDLLPININIELEGLC